MSNVDVTKAGADNLAGLETYSIAAKVLIVLHILFTCCINFTLSSEITARFCVFS